MGLWSGTGKAPSECFLNERKQETEYCKASSYQQKLHLPPGSREERRRKWGGLGAPSQGHRPKGRSQGELRFGPISRQTAQAHPRPAAAGEAFAPTVTLPPLPWPLGPRKRGQTLGLEGNCCKQAGWLTTLAAALHTRAPSTAPLTRARPPPLHRGALTRCLRHRSLLLARKRERNRSHDKAPSPHLTPATLSFLERAAGSQ